MMKAILKKKEIVIFSMILVLALSACSPRKLMVREFVGLVEEGLPAIEQEDDLHLLAQSMPAHIKLLETLLANDPNNGKLLVLLSRLYGGYAFAVLESELEARRLGLLPPVVSGLSQVALADAVARYYQTGAQYALRSLECRYPKAQSQLSQLTSSAQFIQTLDGSDVPSLFWYGFNLGGFVQHRLDSVDALATAHLVEKSMERVIELNASYYHGNAYLALLVYHASRPPMMGGNVTKARDSYQRYGEMNAGAISLGHVYWARYILVRQQEKDIFVRRLSDVGKAADSVESLTLLEQVAVVRARMYLESVDRFFD